MTPTEISEPHAMTLEQTFPSGAQQWHCPVCQRRTVMHYLPKQARLKIITLEAGDETATHCTGSGGLRMGSVSAAERPIHPDPLPGAVLH